MGESLRTRRRHGARLGVMAALAALAACNPSAPSTPIWATDVRPILAANCVRCHGVPATQDAPQWFRLDVYEDTVTDDGRTLRGAGAMAEFVSLRTEAGTMPPQYVLEDYQLETIKNWAGLRSLSTETGYLDRPERGERGGDGDPTMTLLSASAWPDNDEAWLEYELRDPDHDIVDGVLTASIAGEDDRVVTRELHAGRDKVAWDTRDVSAGEWTLTATLDDGDGEPIDVDVGTITVEHGANTAPLARVVSPGRGTIISAAESPYQIVVATSDFDDDALTLSLKGIDERNNDEVVIVEELAVTDASTTVEWDTTDFADSPYWVIEATVDDGTTTRSVRSRRVVVSHSETTEVFGAADAACDGASPPIGCILDDACGWCHSGPYVPGVEFDLSYYQPSGDDTYPGAYDVRGKIYNRVFNEASMPPVSATLSPAGDLSIDERNRLKDWLLGGAPE